MKKTVDTFEEYSVQERPPRGRAGVLEEGGLLDLFGLEFDVLTDPVWPTGYGSMAGPICGRWVAEIGGRCLVHC